MLYKVYSFSVKQAFVQEIPNWALCFAGYQGEYIYCYIQIIIDVYTHFLLHLVKFSSNRYASCE